MNNPSPTQLDAMRLPRASRGFTLTEVVITAAIVVVLASIALPSYRQSLLRSQRSNATQNLLLIAAEQEKFYLQNNTYADSLDGAGLDLPGEVPADADTKVYKLEIVNGDATGYLARATPLGGQADDAKCAAFTIDDQGIRAATDDGGTANPSCW